MTPLNRHVGVTLQSQGSPDIENAVLMPENYNPTKEWEVAQVTAVASDCKMFGSLDVGNTIIFPGNMLVCVDLHGEKHYFVQENYVVCKT